MSQRPPGSTEPVDTNAARTDATASRAESTRADPPENKPANEHHHPLSFLREVPVLIALALVLAILIKTFLVQAFFIPSESMEQTLLPGDRVLVTKIFDEPSRGDVIVFADPQNRPGPDRGVIGGFFHWVVEAVGIARPENEDFIKRVIGLPGENVEIHRDVVYVDGEPLTEPYLTQAARDSMSDFGPIRVPDDALFVMGDNRGNSDDSRGSLGFIPLNRVVGRAFMIVWPPSRMGWVR